MRAGRPTRWQLWAGWRVTRRLTTTCRASVCPVRGGVAAGVLGKGWAAHVVRQVQEQHAAAAADEGGVMMSLGMPAAWCDAGNRTADASRRLGASLMVLLTAGSPGREPRGRATEQGESVGERLPDAVGRPLRRGFH